MSFKFSRGQLVEILWSKHGNEGKRFYITDCKHSEREGNLYLHPLTVNGRTGYYVYESAIQRINPDTDENSEYSFEELMLRIKQGEPCELL